MANRIYNRVLKCGCMYSSDGGGALIPCSHGYGCGKKGCGETKQCKECLKQEDLCLESHQEWYESKDYIKYQKECIKKNG